MARAKRKRKERADQLHREPIVREVAKLLDTGAPTKWRWTSVAHHGVRGAFCLKGLSWAEADKRAGEIVALARHRIGLSLYPTWTDARGGDWEEREYHTCQGCGGYMGANRYPWCSQECANRLYSRRYLSRSDDRNRTRALRVALTGGAELPDVPAERRCRHCDSIFTVHRPKQHYCSRACAWSATYRFGRRDCIICAAPFNACQSKQMTCSLTCQKEARRRSQLALPRSSRACNHCSKDFQPKGTGKLPLFCSPGCNRKAKRALLRVSAPLAEAA